MNEITRSGPTKETMDRHASLAASARDGAPSPTPDRLSLISYFDSIPSTNAFCADIIRLHDGQPEKLPTGLLMAGCQTAGRGRGDHTWISPPGGLYFSVFFKAESVPIFLPLATGLFLSRWLEKDFGLAVKIRWPNDLMLDGKKLGGILCETKNAACIIGVGINVNFDASDASGTPKDSAYLSRAAHARIDLSDLRRRVEAFLSDDFFHFMLDPSCLAEWDRRSYFTPGQSITWKAAGKPAQGIYRGITSEGYLRAKVGGQILELPNAEEVFTA